MKTTKLIFGCGYLGHRVARAWQAQGERVTVATRSTDRAGVLAAEGFETIVADVTEPLSLRSLPPAETLLFAVGYDRRQTQSIGEVYAGGLANVLRGLPAGVERIIYISSTGVYGDSSGDWIDEDTPAEPTRAGGKACLAAEQELFAHRLGDCGIVLRLSGIYGPGRIPRADDLKAGLPLAAHADGLLNLIHVDDATNAVLAAAQRAVPPVVINVTDGRPTLRREYYAELSRLLGTPRPVFTAPADDANERARGGANKRIGNSQMQTALGLELQYPSFREGLAAIVASQES